MKRSKASPNRHKLSEPYITLLKPRAKEYMVWDTQFTGLGVMVYPGGTKTYKVTYQHKGRLRWYTIDKVGAVGLKFAQGESRKIRQAAVLGEDPQGEKVDSRGRDDDETFRAVALRYVEQWSSQRNKSWRQAERTIKTYVLPILGGRQVSEITQKDILKIFDRVTFERDAPKMANQILHATSAIFKFAIKKGLIPSSINPAKGIDANPSVKGERYLSDGELANVWPEFEHSLGLYPTMALKLMLLTGQRPGECCAMRWDDIDRTGAIWTLPGLPVGDWPGTKNKATNKVPLSSHALAILDELEWKETGVVFSTGRRPTIQIPSTIQIWKALGIPRFRPHDLRHTVVSGMSKLKINRLVVQKILNHTDTSTTGIYDQHEYLDEKRFALEAWGNHLMAVVEGREAETNVIPLEAF